MQHNLLGRDTRVFQNAAIAATGILPASVIDVTHQLGVLLQLSNTGTAVGMAAQIEGTIDGTTWSVIAVVDRSSTTPGTRLASITTYGLFFVPTPGVTQIRLNTTALTSGTFTGVMATVPDASQT